MKFIAVANFLLKSFKKQRQLTGLLKKTLLKESRWAGFGGKAWRTANRCDLCVATHRLGTRAVSSWDRILLPRGMSVGGQLSGFIVPEDISEPDSSDLNPPTIKRGFFKSKYRYLGTLSYCWDGYKDVEIPSEMDIGRGLRIWSTSTENKPMSWETCRKVRNIRSIVKKTVWKPCRWGDKEKRKVSQGAFGREVTESFWGQKQ